MTVLVHPYCRYGGGYSMTYEIQKMHLDHLGGQFEQAKPVLFTGAGFSYGAKNIAGEDMPSVGDLERKLWDVCFPSTTFDINTSLTSLFDTALIRHKKRLGEILNQQLTVKPDSLKDWHREIFSFPWHRAYTINIDDIELATERRFDLPRPIKSISALRQNEAAKLKADFENVLHLVHLNGELADAPENVTFSTIQYAERLASMDPFYLLLSAELSVLPFVFIGTSVDEPSLWQYIALRQERGSRDFRELRPRSYLVTPQLDRAKEALLAEFNVQWLPLTGEEFTTSFLGKLETSRDIGLAFLKANKLHKHHRNNLPDVSSLASLPISQTDYLMGQEPIWADIQTGRAIERVGDSEILEKAQSLLAITGQPRGILLITGTAGSGKSTALMRLCLKLILNGTSIGWCDKDSELSPRDLRTNMLDSTAPKVLAIDDADMFGVELSSMLREIALAVAFPLCIIAIRAGRIDRVLIQSILKNIPLSEISMRNLEDKDINGLIKTLDKANRLGILKGKPHHEQFKLFHEQAGRQLLVAMIQATSGVKFEEKVSEELRELEAEAQFIYAIITVASSFRYGLAKDEVLLACNKYPSNKVLNSLSQLASRHLIFLSHEGIYRARHRVIADLVLQELTKLGFLKELLQGLVVVCATKHKAGHARISKSERFLRQLVNHDFLSRTLGVEQARNFFGNIENLLSDDSHYWLQRGSLEVEAGLVTLAENFLNQAKGLAPHDPLVITEFAYLQFKKALENPKRQDAAELIKNAMDSLEGIIANRGDIDAYPFHIIGSQGLSWARRGILPQEQRVDYLKKITAKVAQGCKKHPNNKELNSLYEDLTREILLQATH